MKGILSHDNGNTWKVIIDSILELRKYGYYIEWKVLNTKDYGIPQNRERVFIIGCKNKYFEWPNKVSMNNIENYVDWNDKKESIPSKGCQKILNNISSKPCFINVGFQKNKFKNDMYCPTITTSTSQFWCVPLKRYANIKELLLLQGFNDTFIQVVSNSQMIKQIGNSISVNVLKCVFEKILLP